jgi:hypothetical protein
MSTVIKHGVRMTYIAILALAILVLWLALISGVRPLVITPWVVGAIMVGAYAITGIISNQPLHDRSLTWKIIGIGPLVIGFIAGMLWLAFFIYALSNFTY